MYKYTIQDLFESIIKAFSFDTNAVSIINNNNSYQGANYSYTQDYYSTEAPLGTRSLENSQFYNDPSTGKQEKRTFENLLSQ